LNLRTTQPKFRIAVPAIDNSTCNIDRESYCRVTKLIIKDEAVMAYNFCLWTLNKTPQDIFFFFNQLYKISITLV